MLIDFATETLISSKNFNVWKLNLQFLKNFETHSQVRIRCVVRYKHEYYMFGIVHFYA